MERKWTTGPDATTRPRSATRGRAPHEGPTERPGAEAGLPELTEAQFQAVSRLVYRLAGINLHQGKEALVKYRLSKRLRALDLAGYQEYLDYVRKDPTGRELSEMLDALTTNKTSFFRDAEHFDFLREELIPEFRDPTAPIRIWSAGCSSGEEPYTIAMVLSEAIADIARRDVRILATDISTRALAVARRGVYKEAVVAEVPAPLRTKYFRPVPAEGGYQVKDSIRSLVRVARLNLQGPWPMRGPFDAIFCRNVMIYFDKETQERLVNRFWSMLRTGGYLFVGHSESMTGLNHPFRYVVPAVYRKE